MTETATVRFWSDELDEPKVEYLGPFRSKEDAQYFCDFYNERLSLAGIPSWVANYSVVD